MLKLFVYTFLEMYRDSCVVYLQFLETLDAQLKGNLLIDTPNKRVLTEPYPFWYELVRCHSPRV